MIVVCGEALFDVFTEGNTDRGLELSARIGGSPFNLAVGLARLGCAPMFFGGLSRIASTAPSSAKPCNVRRGRPPSPVRGAAPASHV